MLRLYKSQISSLFATAMDFLTTYALVSCLSLSAIIGSIGGTIAGGVSNFLVSRSWVFKAGKGELKKQIRRYIFTWFGNFLLINSGVYLMTHYLFFNYLISKFLLSIIIGVSYNYLMQRNYIFCSK